jgi:uncharacterized protein (TIGR00369 family)
MAQGDGGVMTAEPLGDAQLKAKIERNFPPCIRLLGGELIAVDQADRRVVMGFVATPDFCHSEVIVQGGFLTAMLDAAMSHAVIVGSGLTLSPPTLELKISFLAPGNPGRFRAEGHALKLGKSVGFLEGWLYNEAGDLIARATSTCRLVPIVKKGRAEG